MKKSGVKNGAVPPLGVGITFLWWVCFRRKRIPKKEIRKNFLQQNFSNLHQENRCPSGTQRSEFKEQPSSLSSEMNFKILAFVLFKSGLPSYQINSKTGNLKRKVGGRVLGFVRLEPGEIFPEVEEDPEGKFSDGIKLQELQIQALQHGHIFAKNV